MTFLSFILTAAAVILCVPVAVLAAEIFTAAILRGRSECEGSPHGDRPRIAVLIPAHDEGEGLLPTIANVKAQLQPGDRLLVVADNCTDNTASLARASGAQVVERCDPERVGKGYALEWGLQHLRRDPPEILIIIDADCRLSAGAIDQLALSCGATGRPAQAIYHMGPSVDSAAQQRVAQFAWLVKTYVRPTGLAMLGLPCPLMGTGMAFPWAAISSARLVSESLVEDVELGLELAANGTPPRLCSHTYVESSFPTSDTGRLSQRRRWEVGSLHTLTWRAPIFLWKALLDRNLPLLVLALDALVPPLVILATILVAFLLVAVGAAIAGIATAPLLIISVGLTLFALALGLAWAVYARHVLRLRDVGPLFTYVMQKFRIYRSLTGQDPEWTRTDRP
jgi:cellulose synthase/poly-beta-1,6-N-acetylglucosamine synthase-like glycosyltransferase